MRPFLDSLWQNLIDGCTTLEQKLFLFGIFVLFSFAVALACNFLCRKALSKINSAGARYNAGLSGAMKYPLFWCFFLTGVYNSFRIFRFGSVVELTLYRWYFAVMVLLILRGMLNAVNFIGRTYRKSAAAKGGVYNVLLADLLQSAAKVILWVLGVLFFLDNVLHLHIGTLLAGAGIASMAVAFAAQNTIANIFGAVTLILDKPFLPGERILINGQEGRVQTIGLRSVRMIAVDGTVWNIPNKLMSESTIINLSRRPYMRHTFVINLTYAHTPEQLQRGKELLREIIAQQPLVNMEQKPPRISFDNIGASSLDLQAICWFQTAEPEEFTKAKDAVNFQILRRFNENGFDFAFPSQSIYVEKMPE